MNNFKLGDVLVCKHVCPWEKQLTLGDTYLVCGTSEKYVGNRGDIIQTITVIGDAGVAYTTSPQLFELHDSTRE